MINTILKSEINILARELAYISGWKFPENYDFFSSQDSRAQYFKALAIRAYEVIQRVEIDDD